MTNGTHLGFSAAQESLFLTLTARALDSQLDNPFLNDVVADELIRELGYDVSRFKVLSTDLGNPRNKVFELAVRAKRLDEVVRDFVRRHPDAVVIDLGAGLDGRMDRVGVPETVDWYDVDVPAVMDLRRRLIPGKANAHSVGVDLRTHTYWIDAIERRPVVIVADGLIPFLSEAMLATLLRRLTAHFPCGEVAFNAYTPLAVFALKYLRLAGPVEPGTLLNPGFFDPRTPERWRAGLSLIEEIAIAHAPEVARLPDSVRRMHRLAGRSRVLSRFVATTVQRYGFSTGSCPEGEW